MIETLKDYVGPLIGVGGMLGGYFTGREQTRSKIRELSTTIEDLQGDVKTMQAAMANQSVMLAEIATDLKWIKKRSDA